MTGSDLALILPLIVLAATSIALLFVASFGRSHKAAFATTILGMVGALVSVSAQESHGVYGAAWLFVVDDYTRFYTVLVLLSAIVVTVISYGVVQRRAPRRVEYYALLAMSTLGSVTLVSASHIASLFLGLELLSVSLYGMIAYPRSGDPKALEAAAKYLILAGASSGFLLFGGALVYAEFGSLDLNWMVEALAGEPASPLALAGFAMMLVGVSFKLGLVPFHLWTPDVYEGAWAPVAAYVSTCSKAAVIALAFRYLAPLAVEVNPGMLLGVSAIAVASMVGGNLYALMQRDLRRVLGYSSVAHMGYALVAFIAVRGSSSVALAFYLTGYCITMLAAFAILSVLADPGTGYRGLARSRPWLAGALAVVLLSLAGMPLTAGFLGKFYLVTVGVSAGLWSLLVALVVANLMGLFVYLRILTAMFDEAEEGAEEIRTPVAIGVLVSVLIALLVWLGTYPTPVLELLESTVGNAIRRLWIM